MRGASGFSVYGLGLKGVPMQVLEGLRLIYIYVYIQAHGALGFTAQIFVGGLCLEK